MQGRRVVLQGRPPLSYDVLSINVGITPSALLVPGAQEHATAVKPIDRSFRNNLFVIKAPLFFHGHPF
jgi:NADH dehydrogenase FAD-containing subunit